MTSSKDLINLELTRNERNMLVSLVSQERINLIMGDAPMYGTEEDREQYKQRVDDVLSVLEKLKGTMLS